MLELQCINNFREFSKIEKDWDDFFNNNFPHLYSKKYSWLAAWWQSYERNKDVYIYIIKNRATKKIIAALPLMIVKTNFGGFPVRKLGMIGQGIGNEDFPIIDRYNDCIDKIFSHLTRHAKWHIAEFSRVSTNAFSFFESINCFRKKNIKSAVAYSKNYCIDLTLNYEIYLAGRPKKFRQNVRTANNRCKKHGTVSYKVIDDMNKAFQVAQKIAGKSWQYKQGSSHFSEIDSEKCFFENLLHFSSMSTCYFAVVFLDRTPIAYLFGVKKKNIFYVVDVAFEEQYSRLSPGTLLYCWFIRQLMEQKELAVFDFGGDGVYKKIYSNMTKDEYKIILYNSNLYGLAIHFARKQKIYSKLSNFIKSKFLK